LTEGVFSSVGWFAAVAGVGARLGQTAILNGACLFDGQGVVCGCWNSGIGQGIIGSGQGLGQWLLVVEDAIAVGCKPRGHLCYWWYYVIQFFM